MQCAAPLLELQGITKTFGNFVANDHINLDVYPGEVHAVLGENGAGKSTLMNIIYGMYKPDSGTIRVNGKPVQIQSPRDALANKIGMVHQHFMLVEVLSAMDNIFLMGEEKPWARRDRKKMEARLQELQQRYHIEVDIHSPVEQLSIGMQQKVEILKLLYTGADVLIFDEPTAILPPQECDSLFEIIENLTAEGKSVIFISHKLEEVLRISQRITVLTRGKVTGQIATENADKSTIIRMMVGEDVLPPEIDHAQNTTPGAELIRTENLCARDNRGVQTLNGVSLQIRAGEVVGIAGVEGNGEIELAEVLAGVRRASAGRVLIDGEEVPTHSAKAFIQRKIAYVPADRNHVGSVADFPLYENWILRNDHPPRKHGLLDYGTIRRETAEIMADFDVRARGVEDRTADLSGGNLQKFIMGRSLRDEPRVLICAYPTRGLDIKAAYFIRERIQEARDRGCGVLLLSGDFEELFALSDRLVVLYRGKIAGEVLPQETTVREVGMMMMGGAKHGEN
jgi:ABC-type uncharacterized transport system ATPase subunit